MRLCANSRDDCEASRGQHQDSQTHLHTRSLRQTAVPDTMLRTWHPHCHGPQPSQNHCHQWRRSRTHKNDVQHTDRPFQPDVIVTQIQDVGQASNMFACAVKMFMCTDRTLSARQLHRAKRAQPRAQPLRRKGAAEMWVYG